MCFIGNCGPHFRGYLIKYEKDRFGLPKNEMSVIKLTTDNEKK